MAKTSKTRPRKSPTAVRSIADSIHDLAGTVLFEAGFSKKVLDKEELVEILRTLEDCREEGRALYPEILLTTRLDDCLKPIHPVQLVMCGESADRPGRFRRALKRCAAVAAEPWVIVLEVSTDRLRYGVASTNVRADAESLYEAVFDFAANAEDLPLMFLRRHGTRAVLLRTVKEERVVSLTLSDELLKAADDIAGFARIVSAKTNEANRPNSERVIQRLLEQACREGHGFISCSVESSAASIPALAECLRAYICVYLGNRYGQSWDAASVAERELKRVSRDRWERYFEKVFPGEQDILFKLCEPKIVGRWIELVGLLNFSNFDMPSGVMGKLISASSKKSANEVIQHATTLLRQYRGTSVAS